MGGTDAKTVRVLPEDAWDGTLRIIARQVRRETNVIKLRKRVLDAMYEESKTLFANIFVNLSKKVLTNQEKCAAVFANSENGPCN